MEHALRLDLRAELLPGPIQFETGGCLTEANCGALLKVLGRALTLVGCPSIIVNLTGLDHLDPGGLHALENHIATLARARRIAGHVFLEPGPVVSIQAPPMPRHCSAPGTVRAFRGIPPVSAAAGRGPARGVLTRGRGPGLAPVVGPAAEWSAPDG